MSDISAVTYTNAFAVTLSDTADDPNGPFAAIQNVATGATAVVITPAGSTVTIYMPQGAIIPLAVKRVKSTTSPTGMIGFKAAPVTNFQ